jgi:hypothetical protein
LAVNAAIGLEGQNAPTKGRKRRQGWRRQRFAPAHTGFRERNIPAI